MMAVWIALATTVAQAVIYTALSVFTFWKVARAERRLSFLAAKARVHEGLVMTLFQSMGVEEDDLRAAMELVEMRLTSEMVLHEHEHENGECKK